jgi:hypothetical protein
VRRQLTAAAIGGIIVAFVVVGILVGHGMMQSSPKKPTPTPVGTIPPVSTPTKPVIHHAVHLDPSYAAFVKKICTAFQSRNASFIENSLMYYQYNTEIYSGPFNLGLGSFKPVTSMEPWLQAGNVRCFRVGQSVLGHGNLATKGWSFEGGWAILDLDKRGKNWHINDFTFGTRAQVMGAFFGNDAASVAYGARV